MYVTAFQIKLVESYIPGTKSRRCLRSVYKSVVPSTLHLLRHEQVAVHAEVPSDALPVIKENRNMCDNGVIVFVSAMNVSVAF